MTRKSESPKRRYLDVKSTAEYLGMTPGAVYKAVERRVLPHRKLGSRILFDVAQLDAYFQSLDGVDVSEAVARQSNNGTMTPLRVEEI